MAAAYRLLPFRFKRIGSEYLLVGDTGQFHFLSHEELHQFVHHVLPTDSSLFLDLKAKDMACLRYTTQVVDSLAARYRTKKRHIFDSTALHMLVLTYRCNQRCLYCHASSEHHADHSHDMTPQTARACVEFAFQSPAPSIKIEFQGGEPTLNLAALTESVKHARALAQRTNKQVEFVVCTNLYAMSEELASFIAEEGIQVSTSLDGPRDLHDKCRVAVDGGGTFDQFRRNLEKLRTAAGEHCASALLTVTKHNLNRLDDVVATYTQLGFNSIFIRMLNPFGRAHESWSELSYGVDDFVQAYRSVLDTILAMNAARTFFVEEYAAILLKRILTPFGCGFVDLLSPSGAATSGMIYDTNGDIFVSDEARMLKKAEDDSHFCLGNVHTHDRNDVFSSETLRTMLDASVIEALPGCAWCAYQPFCGTDPVRNYHLYGDYVSHKPTDISCRLHMALFDHFFSLLRRMDRTTEAVIWSWLTGVGPNMEYIHAKRQA